MTKFPLVQFQFSQYWLGKICRTGNNCPPRERTPNPSKHVPCTRLGQMQIKNSSCIIMKKIRLLPHAFHHSCPARCHKINLEGELPFLSVGGRFWKNQSSSSTSQDSSPNGRSYFFVSFFAFERSKADDFKYQQLRFK